MDPYEANEFKGTRMPDYSQMSRDRDIYGELGWISNFNVKCSKNNGRRHSTNREYFDAPMNYHMTFNNSTMTNSEFFRKNAPEASVAKEKVKQLSVFNQSQFGSTMRSTQSTFTTSVYATPFILDKDVTNRYRVNPLVKKTQPLTDAIPFLRSPQRDYAKVQSNSPQRRRASHHLHPLMRHTERQAPRRRTREVVKEEGWSQYVKPISKFNAAVHKS